MRNDKYRDERAYWSATERSDGTVVDIDPAEAQLVRVSRERRSDPGKSHRVRHSAAAAPDDGGIQRVGGRRRFRPEVALIIVALVFVAGALIKPWPAQAPAGSPSPIAAVAPLLPIAAGPSEAIATPQPLATYPNIPPYNYRWPFFLDPSSSASPSAPGSELGPSAAATPQWSAVDWSILGASDPHAGWGFTAALMPSPGANAASPTTNWVGAGSPPVYAEVPLVRGRYAYAIAVTWPSDVKVTDLKFVYLGAPQSPAYLPPAGFWTNAQVTPLPAESVSASGVAPAMPTIPPWVRGSGGAIRSGSFWIPPSESSPSAISSSLDASWQSSPWPWPYGAYQVTLTSDSGPKNIILDLLLTA